MVPPRASCLSDIAGSVVGRALDLVFAARAMVVSPSSTGLMPALAPPKAPQNGEASLSRPFAPWPDPAMLRMTKKSSRFFERPARFEGAAHAAIHRMRSSIAVSPSRVPLVPRPRRSSSARHKRWMDLGAPTRSDSLSLSAAVDRAYLGESRHCGDERRNNFSK